MESAVAVLRRGGNLALWRGATPLIALVPFQNALLMVGYGAGERWGRGTWERPRRRYSSEAAWKSTSESSWAIEQMQW